MHSTIFTWIKKDYEYLLKTCERDDSTPFILKYLSKSDRIIEAGCGLGRFVKYLSDKGYDIEGIEYNEETVHSVIEISPELKIIQGDVINMPYETGSIDKIISLGVVEHFIYGCDEPLREMYRVLKPGGMAIVTIPCLNLIRKIKRFVFVDELNYCLNPIKIINRSNSIRRLFKKPQINCKFSYNRGKSKFIIYPTFGSFFEYRYTKSEFENALIRAGFKIVESVPISQMDGLYHEFGRLFVSFKNWEFFPNVIGRYLNGLLSRMPFLHNHIHLCVVEKVEVV